MNTRAQLGLALVLLAATGCGLKGPLFLPEKSDVTIRPAPATEPPEAPAPTEPAPAPEPTPEPAAKPGQPPPDPEQAGPDRG
jgi:predicted small lipoprotein YifL